MQKRRSVYGFGLDLRPPVRAFSERSSGRGATRLWVWTVWPVWLRDPYGQGRPRLPPVISHAPLYAANVVNVSAGMNRMSASGQGFLLHADSAGPRTRVALTLPLGVVIAQGLLRVALVEVSWTAVS